MNFFKNIFSKKEKDEVVLRCYTYLPYVYETAPIDYSRKFVPEWWKKTPKINNKENATIKNCLGLIDYFKTGIVIPSWFGFRMAIHPKNDPENRAYSYSTTNNDFEDISHGQDQFELFANNEKVNLKIFTPWYFECDEPINFIWSDPFYHLGNHVKNMNLMPAVVNYKYQHDTNINFILTKDEDRDVYIDIPALTPLVMLHPLTDKKIKIENHLLSSKEEWSAKNATQFLIFNNSPEDTSKMYKNKIKLTNQIDSRNSSCPFHKGDKNE